MIQERALLFELINPPGDNFLNTYPSGTISGPILKNRLWFLVSASPQFYSSSRAFQFSNGQTVDYNRNLRNDYEFARLDSSITNNLRVSGTFTYSPQREHGQIPSYTTSAPPSNDFSQLGGRVAANNVTGSGVWTPTAKLVISARFGRNYLNEKDSSYGVPAGPRIRCLNGGSPAGVPATNPCASGFNSTSDITTTVKDISTRKTFDADAAYLADNLLGRHNFKFGYQLNKLSNDVDQDTLASAKSACSGVNLIAVLDLVLARVVRVNRTVMVTCRTSEQWVLPAAPTLHSTCRTAGSQHQG